MKIALLLPGFIRNDKNINDKIAFANKNKQHKIDIYSSTYSIKGLEKKEHNNPNVYLKTDAITNKYFDKYRKNINFTVEIEDYLESVYICKKYVEDNLKTCIKSKQDFWQKSNNKLKDGFTNDDDSFKRAYGQWRKVFLSYRLILDPSSYDVIIRARYDYDIQDVDLDVCKNLDDNTICMKTKKKFRNVVFNNGEILKHEIYDGLAMGTPAIMEKYCSHGSEKVFNMRMNSDICESDILYENRGASAKLSNELFCSFLCYNYYSMKHKEVLGLSSQPIKRNNKGYK